MSVIPIAEARALRRLSRYRDEIAAVLDTNRQAIGRLYTTGALFSRQGTRAGRDLLLAHQHLLRVLGMLDRLAHPWPAHLAASRGAREIAAIYRELDSLLEQTSELTHRTGHYLARLRGE